MYNTSSTHMFVSQRLGVIATRKFSPISYHGTKSLDQPHAPLPRGNFHQKLFTSCLGQWEGSDQNEVN